MDRTDYEAAVCARINQAVSVPFKEVAAEGWSPQVAQCHENVDAWVRANTGSSVVRGWVTYASFGDAGFGLTAHSLVRDRDGSLFDITPLLDDSLRQGMRFIEHDGDAASYDEMKAQGINIHCLSFIDSLPTAEFEIAYDQIGGEE